jgi:ABC-type nickel/cobalt efflux system permease component RcnA
MLLDANILTSVQVAILGIVVVIGLFVLWRRIARLEERVEAVAMHQHNMQAVAHMQNGGNMPDGNPMDDEALMAAIFELPLGMNVDEEPRQRAHQDGGVTVTEEEPAAPAAVPPHVPLPVQAPESEVAESEAGASKSKLRKLPVEALKDMLMSRGLSCEGNKAALIDRLAN